MLLLPAAGFSETTEDGEQVGLKSKGGVANRHAGPVRHLGERRDLPQHTGSALRQTLSLFLIGRRQGED